MSTYWKAHCFDCDKDSDMLGNHVEQDIVQCVGIYRKLRNVLTEDELHGLSRFDLCFLFESDDETFAEFMRKHHAHRLSARSEYFDSKRWPPDRDEIAIESPPGRVPA